MTTVDIASRLNTQLTTSGEEHYDQVVALTRNIINKSFENLTNLYPDTKSLNVEDEDLGSIHATLLPTQILIYKPSLEISKLGYQIRFASGTLKNPSGTLTQDLTGWILTVLVDLSAQSIDSNTPAEQRAFVDDNFTIPGDYTVERLYAKLTSSNWNNFSMEDSSFGTNPDTGKPLTWDEWKERNPKMGPKLSALLQTWAEVMEDRGLTTLGVKVKLPPATELDPRVPTYPPTAMIHQVFEYRNPDTPASIGTNYNCLLYCEMIQNHSLPGSLPIGNWGNFCYPPAGSSPGIDGTFALSAEVFIGTFLSPHLKPLNQVSEIYVYPAEFSDAGAGTIKTEWDFTVGYNPQHKSPEDPYFMPVRDKFGGKAYVWRQENKIDQPKWTSSRGKYAKFDTVGLTVVNVAWQPGKSALTLSATTTYSYDSVSSDNQDLSLPYAWLKETFQATWNFSIEITTDGRGALDLWVKDDAAEIANLKVVQTRHDVLNTDTPPHQKEHFHDTIQEKMTDTLKIVKDNLAKLFKTSGDFVYPGNGQLMFKDPEFNNRGDLLAVVDYLPLVAGDKVTVPKPDSGGKLAPYFDATKRVYGYYQKAYLPEQ